MVQIVAPVLVFTVVVLTLVSLVLAARRQLVPSGAVPITINGQREVEVVAAACGGRGLCGQCRVRIDSGAGAVLATEAAHVDPDDAARGIRLACMVTVREPLRISVPQEILEVRRWECGVVSNRNVSTLLKELVLELPGEERIEFSAGDYVLVEAPPYHLAFRELAIDSAYRDEWRRLGLLDLESTTRAAVTRAYSLANPPQQDRSLMLIVRLAVPPAHAPAGTPPGCVSSYIFGLKPGDRVAVSGPFGEFHATDNEREMVLISGGAGLAPIRSIVLDQLARGTARKMSLWYGARDRRNLCYADEFEAAARDHENFEFHVALSSPLPEDDWNGDTGFIHSVVFERYLKDHPAPAEAEYYLCGPPVMSAAVVQMLDGLGVERSRIFYDDFGS